MSEEIRLPTFGEIYDAMSEAQRKKTFFFMFRILEFYADPMTWFATVILSDPPCGDIVRDVRADSEGTPRPGGRARLALSWILSAFRKINDQLSKARGPATVEYQRGIVDAQNGNPPAVSEGPYMEGYLSVSLSPE